MRCSLHFSSSLVLVLPAGEGALVSELSLAPQTIMLTNGDH
jgi:hypothetical protein